MYKEQQRLEDNFVFWCPIQKSEEAVVDPTTGESIMRLGGIASTSDEDSDGEFLDPKGFDIAPLLKSGYVNWHHQANGQPATIIGEPSKAEIRPEGLYIETDLYPSSEIAKEVWNLANTLEKDSKTRRLGYSIEGRVVKRKSNNKNSPDYKKISKAIITGVAITHMPKNARTFANIIKGEIGMQIDDTETVLSKSEVMDRIFDFATNISIEKATKIFSLIKKISGMKNEKKNQITEEDIEKAYQVLGLETEETQQEEIEKAETEEEEEGVELPEEEEEEVKKGEDTETEEEETEQEEEEEEGKKENAPAIEKAIQNMINHNERYIKALGVLVSDMRSKSEKRESELLDIIKAHGEEITALNERFEEFANGSNAPKSLRHARPVERTFAKGGEEQDIMKGGAGEKKEDGVCLSMSSNSREIVDILDQATFAKGYDDEFSKACLQFEANKELPSNVISRLKSEYGITISK